MNNNITLHAPQQLFSLNELFAFQHHPQIIAIFIHPLLLMHYHVYLFDISANREVKSMKSPELREKGNVFFIQISSYYYSIERISKQLSSVSMCERERVK